STFPYTAFFRSGPLVASRQQHGSPNRRSGDPRMKVGVRLHRSPLQPLASVFPVSSLVNVGVAASIVVASGACAPGATTRPATDPAPGTIDTTTTEAPNALPPVPDVDGPLVLDVVYPAEGQLIPPGEIVIVGSTGSGRARLTINGVAVEVAANGAFLAFLPVPRDGVYRFEALKDGATASLQRTVQVPPREMRASGPASVAGSTYPGGAWPVQPAQAIELGFGG